ncbi:LssY C-terminal domain-containing protein [Antiquaquibacter soli]|uniref:LssY C-terminal domain-containing protein n=1 Tax=Antiquaquibacter soli TaxID=3064523 RepID=A0ABT9BSU7_9MICO|nr:LssY C-terminal domain-containing protein [Protaetiibacter sp. WY-16]MDO7883478.1 LssY C-terminal domain-containing protein [Protaetiibacter sp. WY-16]
MARRIVDIPLPEFAPRKEVDSALDWGFFVIGGIAAVWLAYLLARESFTLGWWQLLGAVVFWVVLAYLVLPRLHRILTRIYVPDYFIGRARTSDGLLGDPVNLALLGGEPAIHETMTRAGWTLADDLSLRTGWAIVASTLLRRSYLEAPVSPLFLFGRRQDFAYQQEVDGTPGKRHHVRFWRCPPGWMLPGGHPAEWLAAGTYDRAVGLSLFTLQVTHKIAADTDAERDHIVATVTAANPDARVRVIRDFSTGYHARNGGGDSITTDGDLPVVDLRAVVAPAGSRGEVATVSTQRRPAPTIVGAVILALGALSSIAVGIATVVELPGLVADQVDGESASLVAAIVAAGLGFVALFELFLTLFVFLGSNWARVVAMTISAASLLLQAVTIMLGGERLTLGGGLVPAALDILLLLALSSERATVYARSSRKAPKLIAARPGGVAAF